MASPREKTAIRSFVCEQLRAEPDLSVLTVAILRKRYLAQVKSDTLSTEARLYLKEVVQEELLKMLKNADNGSDVENIMPRNKRKREEENEETVDDKSVAKKTCRRFDSSEESGNDESASNDPGKETDHNESEKEEQEGEKSAGTTDVKRKHEPDSEDSSDEETVESVEKANERNRIDSPSKTVKTEKDEIRKKDTTESESPSQDKTALRSESDGDSDEDSSSHENDDNNGSSSSSDENDDENASTKKKEKAKDEKKKQKNGPNANDKKRENKAIERLKHYIFLCGTRRNYKKLFSDCKSIKSKIYVLKKELEDIGIEGTPTIKKCKQLKKDREQEQEIAGLDVGNIITAEGRSRRRGTLSQPERVTPLASAHVRSLNSDSESDEENRRQHKRKTDWSNLRGVISDDASSD